MSSFEEPSSLKITLRSSPLRRFTPLKLASSASSSICPTISLNWLMNSARSGLATLVGASRACRQACSGCTGTGDNND
jgi:hypothetical protein